ncbi:ComEC/Rec2 family competence protein [Paenibacillus macerans]|uniref:ComEC/Rec2 family competence protein n=1 Tax=Paenibacillus macerans TaxID=44252 RepID=UPI00203AA036|nr:ComEC/Rec2 family competence protein [Paenibacillus macerans]MCM3698446.1 MBL fold metallo-hydrolase [Paenibacillus macerans]
MIRLKKLRTQRKKGFFDGGVVRAFIGLMCLGVICTLLSGCALNEFEPAGTAGQPNKKALHSSADGDSDNSLRVIFLDVGQGASQLLISPSGKTMLIDAGNNSEEQHMLDYLREYGVTRLDIVIGSHPDADHIGGLDRVIENVDVGQIYMPKVSSNTKTFESLLRAIRGKGLKVKTAKAGLALDWDEQVRVDMIAPVTMTDDNNNMSAVVKVSYGDTSFLLTADAERESEGAMIDSGADLRADVLLVGHHGSKSSTSPRFLDRVRPEYAVIQVGDNSYGHPTKTVLDRLAKQRIRVYRNDLQGTVEIDSDGRELQILTER